MGKSFKNTSHNVPPSLNERDELPPDLALERIAAISQNARTTWFALLGVLTFVGVTLMGVEHIDFYGYGRETALPLVGVTVPTPTFFYAAPVLTAAMYAYFHFYLMKLWPILERSPSHIEGDALSDRAFPWLVIDAALWLRPDGASGARGLREVSAFLSLLLTWGFGWVVLAYCWWQSLAARDEWMSLISATSLMISIWIGLASLMAAIYAGSGGNYGPKARLAG